MILAVLEGIVMCFVLLIICVVGIANGPVGMVFFYEKEVQDKAVELGLTTRETIKKRKGITSVALLIPQFLLVPMAVYFVNGASDFKTAAVQMTVVYLISGLFDRLFIDWYWVEKTKAWIIPGTEDMRPYIYGKTLIGKWVSTIIGYPILSVLIAWVVSRF
ncbi:MAG: hypothetical protein IJ147_13535 [Lachnospiraceae bacterium]|nr:hypothetical protein [Lachnospiraceae bacterium]